MCGLLTHTSWCLQLCYSLGVVGDRFGRKRILVIGLLIFVSASVLSAFAVSPAMLIGSRALMGIGGAAVAVGGRAGGAEVGAGGAWGGAAPRRVREAEEAKVREEAQKAATAAEAAAVAAEAAGSEADAGGETAEGAADADATEVAKEAD